MGKKFGLIAALCCAFILCFALVGCGGVDKSKYMGDWKLAYGSDADLDADSIELMDSLGISVTLTLNEDGTGSLDVFGKKMDAKWEATSNEEGTITLDGSEATMKLAEEGELTIVDSSDASMTFKRASATSTSSSASASSASSSS